MTFSKGNQLFAGDFRAKLKETNVDIWFSLQRDGTGNGLSSIKDAFSESLQLEMSVRHPSMCIFKAGSSSLYDG